VEEEKRKENEIKEVITVKRQGEIEGFETKGEHDEEGGGEEEETKNEYNKV
jgi:hypothetical protein